MLPIIHFIYKTLKKPQILIGLSVALLPGFFLYTQISKRPLADLQLFFYFIHIFSLDGKYLEMFWYIFAWIGILQQHGLV